MSHPRRLFTTWQSAAFLVNSRLTHFTANRSILSGVPAQQQKPRESSSNIWTICLGFEFGIWNLRCNLLRKMQPAPLLPKLRGQIAEFLNEVSLTRLGTIVPTHLCRIPGRQPWEHPDVFLDPAFNGSGSAEASTSLPLRADRHFQSATGFCTASQPNLTTAGAGILNLLSIVYALRPRLRSRLTLGGRTFPRKPWVYGGQEFNLSYRYSCLHPHFLTLHARFPLRFNALRTLPYQSNETNSNEFQSFGMPFIANHYRREIAR